MGIQLKNINKFFKTPEGPVNIFLNLNLLIKTGHFVSILGPNGCGKSTLLDIITGVDRNYDGYVDIDYPHKTSNVIGYMRQDDLLLPWRTVYQNIVLGLEIQNKITSQTFNIVQEYMELFGILNFIHQYPARLSGGERQRVSLIRTLVLESKILLLDEPFSAIDYKTRLEIQTRLAEISRKKGQTVLLISHDIDEAITLSDRIIVLGKKPCGIINDIEVNFGNIDRNPMNVKRHAYYSDLFSKIWQSFTMDM